MGFLILFKVKFKLLKFFIQPVEFHISFTVSPWQTFAALFMRILEQVPILQTSHTSYPFPCYHPSQSLLKSPFSQLSSWQMLIHSSKFSSRILPSVKLFPTLPGCLVTFLCSPTGVPLLTSLLWKYSTQFVESVSKYRKNQLDTTNL